MCSGTGQATGELAKRFKHVIGVDPSPAQLSQTPQLDNAEFKEGPAEATGLPSSSADMITIAQALHWWEPRNPSQLWCPTPTAIPLKSLPDRSEGSVFAVTLSHSESRTLVRLSVSLCWESRMCPAGKPTVPIVIVTPMVNAVSVVLDNAFWLI
jgi:hypothetical protein